MKLYDETGKLVSIDFASPSNGDILTYDSASGKWKPAAPAGGGQAFVELNGSGHTIAGTADVWEDCDVSAEVPAGAAAVLVAMKHADTADSMIGTRKKGAAYERDKMIAVGTVYTQITQLDASRVFQISAHHPASASFWLLGYWI